MRFKFVLLFLLVIIAGVLAVRMYRSSQRISPSQVQNPFTLADKRVQVARAAIKGEAAKELQIFTSGKMTKDNLASKLGYQSGPAETVDRWLWTNGSKQLEILKDGDFFSHTDTLISNRPQPGSKTPDELKQLALDYLKNLKLEGNNLTLTLRNSELLVGLFANSKANTFAEAEYVVFHFQWQLEGNPVLGKTPDEGLLTLILDKDGRLARFSGPVPFGVKSSKRTATKSPDDAGGDLRNRRAQVVNVLQTEAPAKQKGENFTYRDVYFDDGRLVYRQDGEEIKPTYVYTGGAKNGDNKSLKITVYVPAEK